MEHITSTARVIFLPAARRPPSPLQRPTHASMFSRSTRAAPLRGPLALKHRARSHPHIHLKKSPYASCGMSSGKLPSTTKRTNSQGKDISRTTSDHLSTTRAALIRSTARGSPISPASHQAQASSLSRTCRRTHLTHNQLPLRQPLQKGRHSLWEMAYRAI